MRQYSLIFVLLSLIVVFPARAKAADNVSPESVPAVTAEPAAIRLPSAEVRTLITGEAVPSTEAPASAPVIPTSEEGASYKGIPWGADFKTFSTIKGFAGGLAPFSAALVGTSDDNDLAMLLGVPVSAKGSNGGQRVMFEYLPRKFASVYFEPDDTYYIFYNGKFALTFSKINNQNFDLYRDTFYKKYKRVGGFTEKYEPGAKRSYLLQASIFEKGKTTAFLAKSRLDKEKTTFSSAKLVFAYSELLNIIRGEIADKLAADELSGGEKEQKQLEKDLNKIE